MKTLLKIFSAVGLGLTIIPSVLFFNDVISFSNYKIAILSGSVLWFLTAPFWIGRKRIVK